MKIGVLGCGAMGSVFAGYLSKVHDVYVCDTWQEHVDAIKEKGIIIEEAVPGMPAGVKAFKPAMVTTDPNDIGECDLVICFVRYMFLADAVRNAHAMIGPNTIITTLQNGIGNYDEIVKGGVKEENICIGTTAEASTFLEPGRVKHTGVGINNIGTLKGTMEKAETVAQALRDGGFEVEVKDSVMEVIWHKVFANVAINALTALLEQPNAFVQDNKYAHEAASHMVREAIEVAIASGCELNRENEFAHAFDVAVKTGTNKSSMLQDVTRRKETEIKIINGAVSRIGREHGVPTPYNDMIVWLVQAKQSVYLGR